MGIEQKIFYGRLMLRHRRDNSLRRLDYPSDGVSKMRTALLLTIEAHLKEMFPKDNNRELRIEFLRKILRFDTVEGRQVFGLTEEFVSSNQVPIVAAALLLEMENEGKLGELIQEALSERICVS